MSSSDILRSLRYTLKVNDNDTMRIFALADMGSVATSSDTWVTKEDEGGSVRRLDIILPGFLNGLIYDKHGEDDSAPELTLGRRANNNTVLRKLQIASSLKTGDIQAIVSERKYRASVPGITATMRASEHKSYCECGGQSIRGFLRRLAHRVRYPRA